MVVLSPRRNLLSMVCLIVSRFLAVFILLVASVVVFHGHFAVYSCLRDHYPNVWPYLVVSDVLRSGSFRVVLLFQALPRVVTTQQWLEVEHDRTTCREGL